MANETFLTAIDLPGTDAPLALDTVNGTDIYVGMGRDVRVFTIDSDDNVTQSTFRRFGSLVQDIDINGSFIVVSYGASTNTSGGEVWSLRLSDASFVSRAPDLVADPELSLPTALQISYVSAAGRYFLRYFNELGASTVAFNTSTGVFSDFVDRPEATDPFHDEPMFFLPDLSLGLDTTAALYRIDGGDNNALYSIPSGPSTFFRNNELIVSDGTITAAASDGSAFYAAMTITNSCNLNVDGTRVSVNAYSGASSGGVTHLRDIDFSQSLEEIVVDGGWLYGFYYAPTNDTVLEVVIKSATANDEEWEDTSFDPNTETFSATNIQAFGDKIILQIDEGCKHYLLEYDPANQVYSNQIETYWTVDEYLADAGAGLIYWTNQYREGEQGTGISSDGVLWRSDSVENRVFVRRYASTLTKMALVEPGVFILTYSTASVTASGQNTTVDNFDYIDMNNSSNNATTADDFFTDVVTGPGSWEAIAVNPENKNLIIVDGIMYYFDLQAWRSNPSDPPVVTDGLHYGALAPFETAEAGVTLPFFVLNNVKETGTSPSKDLVYIGGNFYDLGTSGIFIDDFADPDHNLATWTGTSFYSTQAGTSARVSRWQFTPDLELVGSSDQEGTNLGLVTVNINGTPTAVLVTQLANGRLSFITDLDATEDEITNNTLDEDVSEEESSGGSGTNSGGTVPSCGVIGCVYPSSGGGLGGTVLICLTLLALARMGAKRAIQVAG